MQTLVNSRSWKRRPARKEGEDSTSSSRGHGNKRSAPVAKASKDASKDSKDASKGLPLPVSDEFETLMALAHVKPRLPDVPELRKGRERSL